MEIFSGIPKIEKFKDKYLDDLGLRNNLLEDAYIKALDILGSKVPKERFLEFEAAIEKVECLSDLVNKIKSIRKLRGVFESEFISLSQTSKNIDKDVIDNLVDKVQDCLEDIVDLLKMVNRKNLDILKSIMENIKNCPFGQAENRLENALNYQRNVIELFKWLFIDEMRLLTKKEIKQRKLLRDGVFEMQNYFNFSERGLDRIKFSHLYIECKNYCKPSYKDLMQVYAYTLLNKIFPIADNPLCLIVSRVNPSEESIAMKIRDKLFEKEGNKYLLILFISDNDLEEMVNARSMFGDPFSVLKNKLIEIQRRNVVSES